MAPVKQYSCEICGKSYSHRPSLSKHRKVSGHNVLGPPIPKATNFTCIYCEKSFSCRFTFKRHCERFLHIHNEYGQIECLEDNCEKKLTTLQNFICHLKEHGHEFQEGSHEFRSKAEFESWKHQVENQQKCNYVKTSGIVATSAGEKLYYRCHKSGKKIYSKTKRIGFLCTAYMNVKIQGSGCVSVKYNLSHYRHENVLAEMRIPREDKKLIAQQLSSGIPPLVILDKIRDSLTGDPDRIHLITPKDLQNLKSSCGIGKIEKDSNDSTSVHLYVEELRSGENANILLYKPQDSFSQECPSLKYEDFVLGIQTPLQLDMFKKFGPDQVICVDSTHKVTAYDFVLITIMVKDEFDEGFPVAWCISNREDREVLVAFFASIKTKVESLVPSCVMTDDAPQFFQAWTQVFGEGPRKLLCAWHIIRAWTKNLNMICGQTREDSFLLRREVYHTLMVLLAEQNENKFKQFMQASYEKWHASSGTQEFAEYFYNYYYTRPTEWGACYRLGYGINTNMLVEAFHRRLKHNYMRGKVNKRVDKLMYLLFKFAKDRGFEYLNKLYKGKGDIYKQKVSHEKHARCLKMPLSSVTVADEKSFYVTSATTTDVYVVTEDGVNHTRCGIKCTLCGICKHVFSCTCYCYLVQDVMCKHIHLVCQYRKNNNISSVTTEEPAAAAGIPPENVAGHLRNSSSTADELRKNLIGRTQRLLQRLENEVDLEVLQKYEKSLTASERCISLHEAASSFSAVHQHGPNKNIDQQRQFRSTRKKKTSQRRIAKPTAAEAAAVKIHLEEISGTYVLTPPQL